MTKSFDPAAPGSAADGIFGLPFTEKDASLVYLPVPWEATTSYGGGTSMGPSAILEASAQLDLYDFDVLKPYEPGLFLLPESPAVRAWNKEAKKAAQLVIKALLAGKPSPRKALDLVNRLGDRLNAYVEKETERLYESGKIPAIIGGDHSTPYGAIKAAAKRHPGMGILHFDAHHDTRAAYEGFTWSHASIFYNVLNDLPAVAKLVQVGIRDFSEQEAAFCAAQEERVAVFYDGDLARRRFAGEPFDAVAQEIAEALPKDVWVTFDIDGLDPRFCPHTGTPVPGGLEFSEANHVLGAVARSGRRIVGFDLNEVAPDPAGKNEWDANVGARLLYKMTGWALASQGLAKTRDAA
ncbi:MAG: agmatinase family protein [Elusimicrobiota bacterium]